MDVYDVAALGERDREAKLRTALSGLWEAQHEVATAKTGYAIALLRALRPDAGEIRFGLEATGDAGMSAEVYRIDGLSGEVLFDLYGGDIIGVVATQDALVEVEDFLAGAAEAGAHFERGNGEDGGYILRLR